MEHFSFGKKRDGAFLGFKCFLSKFQPRHHNHNCEPACPHAIRTFDTSYEQPLLTGNSTQSGKEHKPGHRFLAKSKLLAKLGGDLLPRSGIVGLHSSQFGITAVHIA
jgi:hypothetical protein